VTGKFDSNPYTLVWRYHKEQMIFVVIRGQEWIFMGIGELQHSCNTPVAGQNRRKKHISIAKQSAPMLNDVNPLRVTPPRLARGRSDSRTNRQIKIGPHAILVASDRLIPIYSQFTMKVIAPMKNEKSTQRLAYRVPTLAEAFDLSPHYIRKEIRLGKLRAYKVGSIWIISVDDARSWLAGFPTNQAQGAESTVRPVDSSPATLN
jgi:hypothetical protein